MANDVHINSVNATVRSTDSQTLLSQQVLEQIVRAVLERLNAEQGSQQRAEADRCLRSGVFSDSAGDRWA